MAHPRKSPTARGSGQGRDWARLDIDRSGPAHFDETSSSGTGSATDTAHWGCGHLSPFALGAVDCPCRHGSSTRRCRARCTRSRSQRPFPGLFQRERELLGILSRSVYDAILKTFRARPQEHPTRMGHLDSDLRIVRRQLPPARACYLKDGTARCGHAENTRPPLVPSFAGSAEKLSRPEVRGTPGRRRTRRA